MHSSFSKCNCQFHNVSYLQRMFQTLFIYKGKADLLERQLKTKFWTQTNTSMPFFVILSILHPLVQNLLLLCVHMWYLSSFIKFGAIMDVINGSLLSLPTLQGIGYDTSPYLVTHKKVLLRERKRHTARRVVSTPSVVLPGSGTPPLGGYLDLGTPPGGVTRTSVPPPGGYLTRVPPRGGYPDLGGGYPDLGPPPGGYLTGPPLPPPVDRQTPVKTVPSRRTTYAGGNKA